MKLARSTFIPLATTVLAAAVLAGCAFPQPISGGAGAPSMPMPSGGPPSGPTGSPPPPSSPSESEGSSGSESPSDPSGSAGPSGPSGADSMPPTDGDSEGGDMDGGPMGGEPLPWPTQDSPGGGSLEELDEQLDDALGDFDDTMGEGSSAGEEEIDILNPMGGSSDSASDQPVFEEAGTAGEGGGAVENESVAQRASAGASGGDSDSSGDQQGGASSSAGATGAAGASAEGQQGNTSTGQAEEGTTDIIPIPDDVGDGRNDDIVLRQIREAAMNEQDPVLREKLWDEYRRIRDQR